MAANDLEEGTDTFSFDEWLSISGLSALKDILIKHEMTSIKALSTESTEFAAFISDPLLLPRAMLIPQAIQSMQQLQNEYKDNINKIDKETPGSPSSQSSSSSSSEKDGGDIEKTKNDDIIAQQQNDDDDDDDDDDTNNTNNTNNNNNNNDDNKDKEGTNDNDENEDDMESLYAKFKEYKKEKEAHRKASKGSLGSLSSLISMDADLSKLVDKQRKLSTTKPSIIREKTEKKKRKMVKLKEGDYVRFVNDKLKEGIVRFIGETEFDDGIFYGIELTSGNGDCDGSYDDVSYFQCLDNNGVFVKRRVLRRIAPKTINTTTATTKLLSSQSTNTVIINNRDRKDSIDSIISYQSDISDIDNLSFTKKRNKNKKKKKRKKKRDKSKSDANNAKTEKLVSREKWKNKIKKKKKQRKNQSRPATLGAVDFSAMFNDRGGSSSTKKKGDDYYKKARQELKKAGPREIGKIKYKGIKHDKKKRKKRNKKMSVDDISDLESDEIWTDDDDNNQNKKQREKEKEKERIKQELKKAGPRDIGKIKYDGLKLSKKQKQELENSKFLDDNLSHNTRKLKKDISYDGTALFGAKQGPQQIGKIKYKGTKLTKKQKEDLKNGRVLEAKLHHTVNKKRKLHRRAKSLVGSKLGPIEMGKTHYKGTKLDPNLFDNDNGDILSEKTHIIIKKKWQLGKGINSADDNNDISSDSDYDYDNHNDNDDTIYVEYNQEKSNSDDDDNDNDNDDDDVDDNALSLRPKRKNTNNKRRTSRNRNKSKQRISSPKPKKKSPKKVRSPRKVKSPRTSIKDNKYDDNDNNNNGKKKRLHSPRSRKRDGARKISKSPNRKPSKLRNIHSSPTPSPARTPIDESSISPISPKKTLRFNRSPVITDNDDTDNDNYYDDDKRIKRNKRKKRDKKDKKKKRKKEKNKDDHVNKYKKKLKAKQRSNPVPRHYASESDQEYIETVSTNNVFLRDEEDDNDEPKVSENDDINNNNKSKPPSLLQSRSISPKNSSLIASPKEFIDYNNVEISPQIKQEEIAHYVHNIDTSEESDTDIDDNGSLNALSSDDEDQVHNNNNTEKRWI